ncbi:MAG TPA: ubiquinol-cytochrome c reductase cytochrome b subunit [Acidimicrobiia bacterium]|nr:ubiquinol-cytochrome c reductase cytochrome b subunit [Acidimicrobiia bacterium]HZQ78840.1 ubiquinol-cytochrome c reductase cytochrome b subunit [Acidimicrobiia bacterium]
MSRRRKEERVVRRTLSFFDERLSVSRFVRSSLDKVFPDHYAFLLGEIALYCFIVLVLTGIFLTFFFNASSTEVVYHGAYHPLVGADVSDAYRSTLELSFSVRAGLVMRQVHHWAALVFIAAIVAHLLRIFFSGAFRKPRELNWMIGVTMLILAIFNGFAGYSLPDDLLSGTGLRIAFSIAESIPLIGTWIAFLLFGGEYPSERIIGRLFAIHTIIVPALLSGLIAAHLAMVWRQKHTQFPGDGHTEDTVEGPKLWPTYAMKSLGLFFAVAAVLCLLGGLFQINPIWLYGPYHAYQVSSPAQPDWYMGWLEGALRLFPPWEIRAFGFEIPNPFFPAVFLGGVTFLGLYAWPFIESWLTRDREVHHLLDRPRDHPFRSSVGAATLSFYSVLFFAASNDLVAKWLKVPVADVTNAFRVAVLVVPLVVFLLTHRLLRALARSGAPRFSSMPRQALRKGFRPAEPSA